MRLLRSMFEEIKAEAANAIESAVKVIRTEKLQKVLTVLYVIVILYITVFSRTPGSERIFKGLFWEYRNGMWKSILLNIILFLPLGYLLGCKKKIIIGLFLSVIIEVVQYIGMLGFCELDDVLNNTVGTVLGYFVGRMVKKDHNRQNDC